MNTTAYLSRAAASLGAIALATALAAPALAEEAANASVNEDGAIVVTARKSSENILKTPVTVTAVTAETLDVKGITTMQNLAASTPGININDNSSGRADRGFQQIVLRGFASATPNATTTSLFIDGVPIASPSAFTSISSPERIEILKGPQSAFYGRNTFAGAINVVNKVPGNDFAGSVSSMAGTFNNVRLHGDVEGALVKDVLKLRLTGDYFRRDGSWVNSADGQRLGNQSTLSGTALAVFQPTSGITIKAFAMASRDKDGPTATGRITITDVRNGAGQVLIPGSANCSFTGDTRGVLGANGQSLGVPVTNPYICGVVSRPSVAPSGNYTNDAITNAFLALPDNRLIAPQDGTQGYGLLRQYRHYHLSADVDLTDSLTFTALAGWNKEQVTTMIDLDGFDSSSIKVGQASAAVIPLSAPRGFYDFPFLVERLNMDNSVEGRLAYTSDRLRGVVGVSYLNAKTRAAQRGTTALLTAALTQPPGGIAQNKTLGAFFGLTYDLASGLSFSAEGRYQVDRLYLFNGANTLNITVPDLIAVGSYGAGSLLASRTFKNFTPRLIVNYDINPDTMVYASWAKGVNPSQFNAAILNQPAAVQTAAAQAGVGLTVQPEKITNWELGLKGRAMNGALRYTFAAFYAQWRNQINSVTIAVPTLPTPTLTGGFQNSGSVDVKGLEADLTWRANDLVTFEFAGAYTDTNIKAFKSVPLSQLTGIFNYAGKEMPFTSKWSTNTAVTFGHPLGKGDARWFWRTDWSYRSGFWSGHANTTRTAGRNVVNTRLGITLGDYTIEGFVTNLFNDTKINSLTDNTLFDPVGQPFGVRNNAALFYNLPDKRTAGIQLRIKF
ncbi:TonB-dependent receptor [Novosphingobium sp.]|uniref:TonB-dependent receptor n=1 Tax=Novosphingobium sp. TaxID=1874826 RepID=UPI0026143237|nr:TonB-dependent receptor [Novosphingobium sp.]